MHDAYFETRFRPETDDVAWPARFVILSACATTGEHWTREENTVADLRLQAALKDWDCWHLRVLGYSPTTGHAEPSWAAELSPEAGLDLGREFLQDAIYEVRDGELWVMDCANPIVREFVGRFAEHVDAADGG